jgi:hypothetical protein
VDMETLRAALSFVQLHGLREYHFDCHWKNKNNTIKWRIASNPGVQKVAETCIATEIEGKNITTAIMEHLDQLIDTVLTDDAHSENLFNAVSSLAKLSREEEAVRTRLASKEVLQRLTRILKTHPRTPSTGDLLAATLRCVGNACVSNPEACTTVAEYKFDWYHAFLVPKNRNLRQGHSSPNHTPVGSPLWDVPPTEVRELTIKVLYNICSQSEEAQKLCYIGGVDMQIFMVLEDYDISPVENPSLAIDLLFWVTSHHKELANDKDAKKTHSAGRDYTNVLFLGHWCMASRATCLLWDKVDVEDYATLLESLLVFLRDPAAVEEIKSAVPMFFLLWRILTCIERKIKEAEGDAEDVKLLAALSTSFTWVLSDISATPAFAYQVTTNQGGRIRVFVEDLSQLLTTGVAVSRAKYTSDPDELVDGDALRLHSAACQIFGNMLYGQVSSEDHVNGSHHQDREMQPSIFDILTSSEQPPLAVQDRHIYQRLFALMTTCDNADFLHSAAGFLIQLSRPSPEVRAEIASDDNALAAIRRMGQHPMQQLNQDALMLMRALGKDTPSVQEKLKELAGEVMATVAETQKAAADAQTEQPAIANIA